MILKLTGLQKILDAFFNDHWTAVWPLESPQKRRKRHAQHHS